MDSPSASSAISAHEAAAGSKSLSDLQVSRLGLTWTTTFPAEQGRQAIMVTDGTTAPRELIPSHVWVGTRVHEYGGRAYCIADRTVIYSNLTNGSVSRYLPGEDTSPHQLIAPTTSWYGDFSGDPLRKRVYAIYEDRTHRPFTNSIVVIDTTSGTWNTLWHGSDFVISPRPSPDGTTLAWIAWDQPSMPWDAGALWMSRIGPDGDLINPRRVLGGALGSVNGLCWSHDNTVIVSWEGTDYWNLYRIDPADDQAAAHPIAPMERECGLPQWNFGLQPFTELQDGAIVTSWTSEGKTGWSLIEATSSTVTDLPLPFTSGGRYVVEWNGRIAGDIAGINIPVTIASWDRDGGGVEMIAASFSPTLLETSPTPEPTAVVIPTRDGETAFALFSQEVPGTAPMSPAPMIIKVHGGPTSQAKMEADLSSRYWTTHGFQILHVNYRGSSGYGRRYRQLLDGRWGELDVTDCCDAALWAIDRGYTAADRVFISGSSSGGLTVLAALVSSGPFAAGTSYYGVADIELLRKDCHKFEEEYLDTLVAPPSAAAVYHARSPIHQVDSIDVPVLFFHGLEDTVVPVAQTRVMVSQLEAQGKPVAVRYFPHEGHRFGKAENIAYTLEAERFFYLTVMGLEAESPSPKLEIRNYSAPVARRRIHS